MPAWTGYLAMLNPFRWISEGLRRYRAWCDRNGITLRDKLLVTVGTMAMLWYFTSIIVVGCVVPEADAAPPSRPVASSESTARPPSNDARRVTVRFPIFGGIEHPLPEDLINFMAISITTISGTLATYLGLILGISEVKDRARLSADPASRAVHRALPGISTMQSAAAWSYVASLIIALVFWAVRMGDLNDVVVNLARSILGLFGGVLAVILNVERPAAPEANLGGAGDG